METPPHNVTPSGPSDSAQWEFEHDHTNRRAETIETIERQAMRVVCAYFQGLGLAGPSVAHVEHIIDALNNAGLLREPA